MSSVSNRQTVHGRLLCTSGWFAVWRHCFAHTQKVPTEPMHATQNKPYATEALDSAGARYRSKSASLTLSTHGAQGCEEGREEGHQEGGEEEHQEEGEEAEVGEEDEEAQGEARLEDRQGQAREGLGLQGQEGEDRERPQEG